MSVSLSSVTGVLRRRWLWVVTVTVLLGLLLWIPNDTCTAAATGACVLPDDPLPQRAAVGATAQLRLGTISVEKAQAGTRLTTDTEEATTEARFVLVSFSVTAADRPRTLKAKLKAGERTYTPVGTDIVPVSGLFAPGLPGKVQKLFELPVDALNGDLVVEANLGTEGDVAVVNLGRVTGEGTLRADQEPADG